MTVVRIADPAALVVEYRGADADRFELGVSVDLTVGAEQAAAPRPRDRNALVRAAGAADGGTRGA